MLLAFNALRSLAYRLSDKRVGAAKQKVSRETNDDTESINSSASRPEQETESESVLAARTVGNVGRCVGSRGNGEPSVVALDRCFQ